MYSFLLLFLAIVSLSSGQLPGAEQLTKEHYEELHKQISLSPSFLLTRDVYTKKPLIPVEGCMVILREYGRGIIVEPCVEVMQKFPLIDKQMPNVLLAYRCYRSDPELNPSDYELHTAMVDRIEGPERLGPLDDVWYIYFKPQEAYGCRVGWSEEESVKSTINYVREQQGKKTKSGEAVQPLTNEQFEIAFDKLIEAFHTFPYFSYIFAQDQRMADKRWTQVLSCFAVLIYQNKAMVVPECALMIWQYRNINPEMPNLRLAYRCFKSDNPYDYELQTTAITQVAFDLGANPIILFKPINVDHCRPKYLGSRPIDLLLFTKYLNDTKQIESSRVERADRLSKDQFEAAFPLKDLTRPYLTFVFAVDLALNPKNLVPVRECLVMMFEQDKGIVSQNCAEIIGHYYHVDKSLPNVILPYRCFRSGNPDADYELYNSTITQIALEKGQYVLHFTVQQVEHCAPVWAKEKKVKKQDDSNVDTDGTHDEL